METKNEQNISDIFDSFVETVYVFTTDCYSISCM